MEVKPGKQSDEFEITVEPRTEDEYVDPFLPNGEAVIDGSSFSIGQRKRMPSYTTTIQALDLGRLAGAAMVTRTPKGLEIAQTILEAFRAQQHTES